MLACRSRNDKRQLQCARRCRFRKCRAHISEGFSAASTNEIARRANLSKTTFYSRFPTKERLFQSGSNECVCSSAKLNVGLRGAFERRVGRRQQRRHVDHEQDVYESAVLGAIHGHRIFPLLLPVIPRIWSVRIAHRNLSASMCRARKMRAFNAALPMPRARHVSAADNPFRTRS